MCHVDWPCAGQMLCIQMINQGVSGPSRFPVLALYNPFPSPSLSQQHDSPYMFVVPWLLLVLRSISRSTPTCRNPLAAERDHKVYTDKRSQKGVFWGDTLKAFSHSVFIKHRWGQWVYLCFLPRAFPSSPAIAGLPPPSSSPVIRCQTTKLLMVGLLAASLHTVHTGNHYYYYYYYYYLLQ